jgi:hypothetical protein
MEPFRSLLFLLLLQLFPRSPLATIPRATFLALVTLGEVVMEHWKDPCLPEVVEYAELGDHFGYPSQGMWRSLWFLVTRYEELATIMGYPSQGTNTRMPNWETAMHS